MLTAEKLCKILNCPINEVVEFTDDPPKEKNILEN